MQLIQELQEQHERQVAALLMEKDRQLQEETAATPEGKRCSRRLLELIRFKSLHDFWSYLSRRCDDESAQTGAGEESTHPG